MKWLFKSEILFLLQLSLTVLIALGTLERQWVFFVLLLWVLFIFKNSTEDSVVLFIASIPMFIALPLVKTFDNFNAWRIISGLIFLRWFFNESLTEKMFNMVKNHQISFKKYTISGLLIIIFMISSFSIFIAQDQFAAVKRIIYFANILLIPILIFNLTPKSRIEFTKRIFKSSFTSGLLVSVIGFIQLGITYFWNPDKFLKFWSLVINTNLYGETWGRTVLHANTWFSYFGEQLSLRMFSSFPDSHTFPMFLIMTLPGLIYMKNTVRNSIFYILYSIFILAIILSGTRGIWLAFLGPILLTLWFSVRKYKDYAKVGAKSILVFFVCFGVAYFIFSSSQFQMGGDELIKTRIKSILDANELSNSSRILIWKETLKSIKKHPFLGVGLGNFPIILNQDIDLAKAGSSAHNLYLNFFAEIGLIGGGLVIYLLWLIFRKIYVTLILHNTNNTSGNILYSLFFILLSYTWVLLYSLTDAALTDERSFLMFTSITALFLTIHKKEDQVFNSV